MNKIPQYFIEKVKMADGAAKLAVREEEMFYIHTLVNNGYINATKIDSANTLDNYHDFSIEVLKPLN